MVKSSTRSIDGENPIAVFENIKKIIIKKKTHLNNNIKQFQRQ